MIRPSMTRTPTASSGSKWLDDEGARVPTSIIRSFPGADHCGWGSVTFLVLENRDYIRDPRGLIDVPMVMAFDDDAALPAGAVDTGYQRGGRRLWISVDRRVAYVVDGDRVEAWPAPDTADPVRCA